LKEQQRLYIESRVDEVECLNQDLAEKLCEVDTILVQCLERDPKIDFRKLLVSPKVPQLDLGDLAVEPQMPSKAAYQLKPLSPLVGWLPWFQDKHERERLVAEREFANRCEAVKRDIAERQAKIDDLKRQHARKVENIRREAEEKNSAVRQWYQALKERKPDAVATYFQSVLSNSPYPDGFPCSSAVGYLVESKQLVVEYDLPKLDDIIPAVKSYKYIKARDEIAETAASESQRRSRYASTIAQTMLRTLFELFRSAPRGFVETIVLNGFVDTIDRSTGRAIRPCVASVRTTSDVFCKLDLQHVNPVECLRALSASFSKSPAELAPVRPILELNMCDPRFIQEADVISTLDKRPNLMELTPGDFESLITNLFQKMGLETKLTQASRDGGVDCVAFDSRPILGGKVVIQAKRYRDTVGVSAVRDLFGTMMNEGASKGILVATSGFGKAAFEFANDKPIELIGGGQLLYLLKEHAGLEAKIISDDKSQ